MQSQSKRGNRSNRVNDLKNQSIEIQIRINTFKDFLNSRLNFQFPQGFSGINLDQKQDIWKKQLQKLLKQREKVCFYLPDKMSEEQVQFGIKMIEKYDSQHLLDYEYESMFLGNKKQLLIYFRCQQMNSFLQKYKLNKQYETQIKKLDIIGSQLTDKQAQINVFISTFKTQQINQLKNQISVLKQKFLKAFDKFSTLLGNIFEHFKSQKKRKMIILSAIRYSIFQKIKELGPKYELDISNRFPQIQLDEILDVQIARIGHRQKVYVPTQQQNKQVGQQETDSDKSSFVSSLSDDEEQYMKKQSPKFPVAIRSVYIQKYQNKILELKIILQSSDIKEENIKKLQIQYSYNKQNFEFKKSIQNPKQHITILIPIAQKGFVNCNFRTHNQAGYSQTKPFKYFLNVEKSLESRKNGNLLMIGQSQIHIPKNKVKKQGQLHLIPLAASDFSISSTHTILCDKDCTTADWGYMKTQSSQKPQIVQTNDYFNIVNNAKKMIYQQPAIRLQKKYQIRKVSAGRGYALMLDCFGQVWGYGNNQYGQLGFKQDLGNSEQRKIKFFQENKIFVIDIKATQSGASFCIDSKGQLFKWGVNQLICTNEPIYDRFGSIINYSLSNCINQQWCPLPVKKHFEKQRIIQIESGNQFYLALNNENTLYGWGECRNLGKGILKDGKDNQIQNICNQIQLMQNVIKFSAGNDHAIAVKKDGKVYGWGNIKFLSNKQLQFKYQQFDLTEQYGKIQQDDIIKCGPNFTCLYKKSQNMIKIFASQSKFPQKLYNFTRQITKIQCTTNLIALLTKHSDPKV